METRTTADLMLRRLPIGAMIHINVGQEGIRGAGTGRCLQGLLAARPPLCSPFGEEEPDHCQREGHPASDFKEQIIFDTVLAGLWVIDGAKDAHAINKIFQSQLLRNRRAVEQLPERLPNRISVRLLTVNLPIDAPLSIEQRDLKHVIKAGWRGLVTETEFTCQGRND